MKGAYRIASLALTGLLCWSQATLAFEWHLRAREHFDQVTLIPADESLAESSHPGIGPTLNLWLEDPYRFYFGYAYSWMRIGESLRPELGLGEKAILVKHGLEMKFFPWANGGGLFFRLGVSQNYLNTKTPAGELQGRGSYRGLGWEFPTLSGKLGLAFEAAWREVRFEDLKIESYSPSIGVHFYGYI